MITEQYAGMYFMTALHGLVFILYMCNLYPELSVENMTFFFNVGAISSGFRLDESPFVPYDFMNSSTSPASPPGSIGDGWPRAKSPNGSSSVNWPPGMQCHHLTACMALTALHSSRSLGCYMVRVTKTYTESWEGLCFYLIKIEGSGLIAQRNESPCLEMLLW